MKILIVLIVLILINGCTKTKYLCVNEFAECYNDVSECKKVCINEYQNYKEEVSKLREPDYMKERQQMLKSIDCKETCEINVENCDIQKDVCINSIIALEGGDTNET